MRTGNPGHLKGFAYVGLHRYFLTFCTNQRRALFTSTAVVSLVLARISRAADDDEFAVLVYCFMPDHLHLLIEGKSVASDCRRFMSRAKQLSGFHYGKIYGEKLWQRYGFERVLRDDETTMAVAQYIVGNPVRAGLVQSGKDYPFVGSLVYTLDQLLDSVMTSDEAC